jgi:competence protein CoiA
MERSDFMFVAQHISGERFVSFQLEEKILRQYSRQNELKCPICNDNVIFRSGTKNPHFYHKRQCNNPDPYSEPESLTHMEGKYQIYFWLKYSFPNSQVELEYGVPKTNQRSDVMLILPSGDRIAFEFQCSSIAEYRWLERHQLYQDAGTPDVWILNIDFLNDSSKFTGLERAIYDKKRFVQYLNTDNNSISHVFRGHRYNSFIDNPIIVHGELLSAELRSSIVWSKELENYFIGLEEQKRLEEEELVREAEFKKRQKEDEKIQVERARRYRYQETQIIRQNLEYGMNEKEAKLFQKLFKKYAYTHENFPGLFMVKVNHGDLINTPPQLWQLWIFDQIRATVRTYYKKDGRPKVWLENIVNDFKQLRASGEMRIKKNDSDYSNYTFALYSYFNILNIAGILLNLGMHTSKYQEILTNDIPLFQITRKIFSYKCILRAIFMR